MSDRYYCEQCEVPHEAGMGACPAETETRDDSGPFTGYDERCPQCREFYPHTWNGHFARVSQRVRG
jgi:hypothetical protein